MSQQFKRKTNLPIFPIHTLSMIFYFFNLSTHLTFVLTKIIFNSFRKYICMWLYILLNKTWCSKNTWKRAFLVKAKPRGTANALNRLRLHFDEVEHAGEKVMFFFRKILLPRMWMQWSFTTTSPKYLTWTYKILKKEMTQVC